MAGIGNVKMPIKEVTETMTMNVRVTGLWPFTWRMRIGVWLIKFAAWVMPMRVFVETWSGEPEEPDDA